MSNYTIATNFGAKDALISGNPAKLILGAQFTTEFTNIATAIATKFDVGSTGSFADGTPALPGIAFTNNTNTGIYNSAGTLGLATSGLVRLTIGTGGGVTIFQPSSGNALTIGGNIFLTGQSGANINITPAGAGAVNQSSFQYFTDNNLYIDAPATGTPTGGNIYFRGLASNNMASLNGGNLSVANGTTAIVGPVYAGIPQNSQSTNYTFLLGDANKHLLFSGAAGQTYTIPANASVSYPIGTAITIVNTSANSLALVITSDSLLWLKGGSGALGSRILATSCQVTILKVTGTIWTLAGNGIS